MRRRKGRLAKLLSLPVLAVCGFAVAATMAGVGVATTTPTDTTPTTPPTTSPTTSPTTTTPPGEEGCTPGFWKNHLDAWVGFSPGDSFATVFGVALPGQPADLTLEQALDLGGGGVEALARHAVAALLNAAHPEVDYPFTEAEIIALVQGAIGGTQDVETVKNMFEAANELTAPPFCD
jgi:hypothetical protein